MRYLYVICSFLLLGFNNAVAQGQSTTDDQSIDSICSSICGGPYEADGVCVDLCDGCVPVHSTELNNAKTAEQKKAILQNCVNDSTGDDD